jgi:hypothetical protein
METVNGSFGNDSIAERSKGRPSFIIIIFLLSIRFVLILLL